MTTGGAGSSGTDTSPKKKGRPKGRKRRLLPKDTNAPKGPLSGGSWMQATDQSIPYLLYSSV